MKKRLFFLTLSMVLVLGLGGCGSEGTTEDETMVSEEIGDEYGETTEELVEEEEEATGEATDEESTEETTEEATDEESTEETTEEATGEESTEETTEEATGEESTEETTEEATDEELTEETTTASSEASVPIQSEVETNPAFYDWVSRENEAADIAWFTENFGATEAELRTWTSEQWDYAMYVWMYGEAPSNKKTIGYDVCVDGLGFAEEYYIEAETVYDVLIEAGFYNYHGIEELYVNGVLMNDDPRNIPVNDGDEIHIEAYDIY